MSKTKVNGPDANMAYQYLRVYSELEGGPIPWNFAKFIIDKNGSVVNYFTPETDPDDIIPTILEVMKINTAQPAFLKQKASE